MLCERSLGRRSMTNKFLPPGIEDFIDCDPVVQPETPAWYAATNMFHVSL